MVVVIAMTAASWPSPAARTAATIMRAQETRYPLMVVWRPACSCGPIELARAVSVGVTPAGSQGAVA